MRKVKVFGLLAIVITAIIAVCLISCNPASLNDDAEADENGRYLTVINSTNQVINKIHVTVGEGTEIESMQQTNMEEKSLSIKIPEHYSEYSSFTVILVDRYDAVFQKTIDKVKEKGRTEVNITKDDCVHDGGLLTQIEKALNGD